MAGRPKKVVTENTTVENKVETTTKTNTVDNSAEMDSLRKENEELLKAIAKANESQCTSPREKSSSENLRISHSITNDPQNM